jgi:hypothetical protein
MLKLHTRSAAACVRPAHNQEASAADKSQPHKVRPLPATSHSGMLSTHVINNSSSKQATSSPSPQRVSCGTGALEHNPHNV